MDKVINDSFTGRKQQTFWNEVAIVYIIARGSMWYAYKIIFNLNKGEITRQEKSPRGAIGSHRKVSLSTDSTYGSDALSSNVGKRSLPITELISACARR
jgi:hypothetical protein